MTTTTAEKIKVMQAFEDGKKIEWKAHTGGNWQYTTSPTWAWDIGSYRVKEEPREFMLLIDNDYNVLGGGKYELGFVPLIDSHKRIPPNTKMVRVKEVL